MRPALFKSVLGALAFAVATSSAQAPPAVPRINVGSSAVDGSMLKPYKNAWKVVYAVPGKDAFLVGVWSDELSATEAGGHHFFKRSQMADYAKYGIVTTYTNVFDAKTLAPVSMDFKRSDTGEWAHREFEKNIVRFHRGGSGDAAKTKAGQLELKVPVFDYNGGTYGVFLASLPLHEGFQAQFPTLSEDRDELEWITINVGKQELVEAGPGKEVKAWPVETEGNYDNKSHSTFWISKEAPYVIKLVTTIPAGKGVTVTMTML